MKVELTIKVDNNQIYFNDTWEYEGKPNLWDYIIVDEMRAIISGIMYSEEDGILKVWAIEESFYEQERATATFPIVSISPDWKGVWK